MFARAEGGRIEALLMLPEALGGRVVDDGGY